MLEDWDGDKSLSYYHQAFAIRRNKIIEIGESRREWLLNKFEFEAKKSARVKDFKIWTDDNHAIEIYGYISIEEKINYIHQNPVKAMIVYSAEQYVFSSAIDYADGIGIIKITKS